MCMPKAPKAPPAPKQYAQARAPVTINSGPTDTARSTNAARPRAPTAVLGATPSASGLPNVVLGA